MLTTTWSYSCCLRAFLHLTPIQWTGLKKERNLISLIYTSATRASVSQTTATVFICLPFLLFAHVNLPVDFQHLNEWCLLRHHHALKLVSLYRVLCNICADYVCNILTVLYLFIEVLLCTLNCILQQSCTCILLWGSIKYSFIFIYAIYLLIFSFYHV